MAVKNIAITDTLETFRTTFNDMAANDFGDIALLSGSISSTNLVGAMNETISIATSTAGWTVKDSANNQQIVGGGDTLTVAGTSNEIEAVVSATDTLTIGLPSAVSITTSITAPTVSTGNLSLTNGSITDSSGSISFGNENLTTTGTITANSFSSSGTTHALGTIAINGNTISSSNSDTVTINDNLRATTIESSTGLGILEEVSGYPRIRSTRGDDIFLFDAIPVFNSSMIFEGSANNQETTITVVDPTADRTINIPDADGTIVLTGNADIITESMVANDAIGQNELKTVVTLQILNSSGTALKTLFGAGA
tara:strand:- start:984 stop:1916 length:933 start_codon:yes stop_codon:yes gene_type:complete